MEEGTDEGRREGKRGRTRVSGVGRKGGREGVVYRGREGRRGVWREGWNDGGKE